MDKYKPKEAKDRIILALDVDNIDDAIKYVDLLKDYVGFFKVGLPFLTSCGIDSINIIKEHGGRVYFDGKFHDIPNAVAQASVNLLKTDYVYWLILFAYLTNFSTIPFKAIFTWA